MPVVQKSAPCVSALTVVSAAKAGDFFFFYIGETVPNGTFAGFLLRKDSSGTSSSSLKVIENIHISSADLQTFLVAAAAKTLPVVIQARPGQTPPCPYPPTSGPWSEPTLANTLLGISALVGFSLSSAAKAQIKAQQPTA